MTDYRTRRRRRRLRSNRTFTIDFKNIFFLSKLSKYILFAAIAMVLSVPVMFLWFSRDLPTPGKLVVSKYNDSTRIYDRRGVLLYSVYQDQNRSYVKLDNIPKDFRNATIAIEDQDFYKNSGFSPIAYVRVARNAVLGRGLAGGSTITQQLVKNILLTSERSLPRKIKELVLAIQVNNRFSKDQILEIYLNNIPYGSTAVGVEAASETYFGKKAKDLTLAESVFLAGLPQSPTNYSPYSGNKLYIGRSEAVLKQMVDNRFITKDESKATLEKIKSFKFSQREVSIKAPHFVMYVKEKLAKQFGESYVESGGLQVTTTLDYELQKDAEKIVKEEIEELKGFKVSNGTAMITKPDTGEILAMVGSKDYFDTENDGNFNVAVRGERQPGSSLKPIVYAKAFEKGYAPSSLLMDVKTEFSNGDGQPPYAPGNYNGKFSGPMQLRFALGNSINIPAVKLLALVGVKDTMQLAYDMGISNWEPTAANRRDVGLSVILGGRETTLFDEVTAYGVFANGGNKQDLVTIQKVVDNKGKKLFEYEKEDGDRVLSEEVSFLISHILLDNNARTAEFGPNSFLRIPGKTVAVKTGTTDEKRDNWCIGYTPSFVVGVWVGNNDNTPMNPKISSGSTGATPIWNRLMVRALKDESDEEFTVPENVASLQIDAFAGGLPVDGQPTRSEYFVKGTEPKSKSAVYQKDFYVFREDDPVSSDGKNRWQEGINAWIEQNHKDNSKYHPPGDILDVKKDEDKEEEENDTDPTETPTPTLSE